MIARRALFHIFRPALALRRPGIVFSRQPFSTSYISRQATEQAAQSDEIETLNDAPIILEDDTTQVDWSRSFHGLSIQPFNDEAAQILTAPIDVTDVEIKPGTPTLFLSYRRWNYIPP